MGIYSRRSVTANAVARSFHRELNLPGVEVPDWELLARLEELFRPYRPVKSVPGGERILSAKDSRGSYDAATVSELRDQADAQDEPPHSMSVMVAGKNVYGKHYDLAVTAAADRSYAGLYSDDESMVTHVATRLLELFGRAASNDREGIAYEANATGTALELSITTKGARRARWTIPLRRFIYDPWTIAVGSAIIAGLVLWACFRRVT